MIKLFRHSLLLVVVVIVGAVLYVLLAIGRAKLAFGT